MRVGKFPEGFVQQKTKETEVIRWLLKEDPAERPSTAELLKSDMLPSKLEYEIMREAIRTIVTPDTTIFGDLMDRLFQNSSDEHLDFTYDANTARPVVGLLEAGQQVRVLCISSIIFCQISRSCLLGHEKPLTRPQAKAFEATVKIFRRHGAVQLDTPLFFPKSQQIALPSSTFSVLDPT